MSDEYDDNLMEDFDDDDDEILDEEEEEIKEEGEDGDEEDDDEDEDDDLLVQEDASTYKEVSQFKTRQDTVKNIYTKVYEKNIQTIPILTKYEKARLLGERAMEIAKGAPTLVDTGDMRDPKKIAKKELKQGLIPFLIKRNLPTKNGKTLKCDIIRPSRLF